MCVLEREREGERDREREKQFVCLGERERVVTDYGILTMLFSILSSVELQRSHLPLATFLEFLSLRSWKRGEIGLKKESR